MPEPQLGVDDRDQVRLNRWIERGQARRLTAKLPRRPSATSSNEARPSSAAASSITRVSSERPSSLAANASSRRAVSVAGVDESRSRAAGRRRQSTGQLDERKRVPGGLCQHASPHDGMQIRRAAIQHLGCGRRAQPLQPHAR